MRNEKNILVLRNDALNFLQDKVNDFALGGGTALSLAYFQHRESYDLDFFTQNFSENTIQGVMDNLAEGMKKEIKLLEQFKAPNKARIILYEITGGLRIDFIEDFFRDYKVTKMENGIPVLSAESIYLRKIYATCGIEESLSETGRKEFIGGRQAAKDYFDLYVLSHTFMPLSRFVETYCNSSEKERVIIWYRRYDRLRMVSGLLDLRTPHVLDVKVMDKHFNAEIQKMIVNEMG